MTTAEARETLSDYKMLHKPEMTEAEFVEILSDSPAAGEARAMYRTLKAEGVSPAVLAGFFWVESKFGAVGVCRDHKTKSPGNVRTPEYERLASGMVDVPGKGRYAKYATWADGTEDWCHRIKGPKYGATGLATVREVLLGGHPGIGAAGRVAVERGHDWAATLRRLDPLLEKQLMEAS